MSNSISLSSRKSLLILLVAISLAALSSCSFAKNKSAAEAAVTRFHFWLDKEDYKSILNAADKDFRKQTSDSDAIALFEAVHRKLGTVQGTSEQGWNVNTTLNGTEVRLSYSTDFADGKAVEQFVYHVTGDEAKLYGYNISSPQLITK